MRMCLAEDLDHARQRSLGAHAHVQGYQAAGVDRLVLLCLAFDQDLLRTQLDDLVRDVLDPVRG